MRNAGLDEAQAGNQVCQEKYQYTDEISDMQISAIRHHPYGRS